MTEIQHLTILFICHRIFVLRMLCSPQALFLRDSFSTTSRIQTYQPITAMTRALKSPKLRWVRAGSSMPSKTPTQARQVSINALPTRGDSVICARRRCPCYAYSSGGFQTHDEEARLWNALHNEIVSAILTIPFFQIIHQVQRNFHLL